MAIQALKARNPGIVTQIAGAFFGHEFSAAHANALEFLKASRDAADLKVVTDALDSKIKTLGSAASAGMSTHQEAISLSLFEAASTAADLLSECRNLGIEVDDEVISRYCDIAFDAFRCTEAARAFHAGTHCSVRPSMRMAKAPFDVAMRHNRMAEAHEFGEMALKVGAASIKGLRIYETYTFKDIARSMYEIERGLGMEGAAVIGAVLARSTKISYLDPYLCMEVCNAAFPELQILRPQAVPA